ncbi:hypothetical protein HYFRA_00002856 [Hymenoscyphus fraxineus]|uniref:ABC multidrug transporter atrF n=1 Tax=Hymenoscyphus fraxineus TaxID=746836 RepID=A0A9N9PQN3_9HELO|nr:hypothetical protein HYFRA_00002856 [Hymenoscyphus fraxineus]
MFYTTAERSQRDAQEGTIPLHNVQQNERPLHAREETSSSSSGNDVEDNGTWGERDIGGPVNLRNAMLEYENMRREFTHLSKTRSTKTEKSQTNRSGLRRLVTGASGRSHAAPTEPERDPAEIEEPKKPESLDEDEDFELSEFLKDGFFEKRQQGKSAKKVGVVYKNLTVEGVGATATFVKTLPGAVMGTFGPDFYKLLSRFVPFLPQLGSQGERRDLIHDFSGVVRDGEMLLVLGRPGSGCSTFLKAISNKRDSFAGVNGEVSYGGIPAKEQREKYRGEVVYNEEDDLHFPTLTVEQTLDFSLSNKTRKHEKGDIPVIIGALLKMFGITHTRHTLVGDAFVRGISGGERKRVSIAETLATKSTVVSWDNSTRGLDASTALDYANSLRVMTDISNRTTLVTLYQAGEGIYELMDKVLVIDEGRMIYQGPANEAKRYFEDLGYHCPDRKTTPDFLTSITDPEERKFRDGFEGPIPKGPIELEKAFKESESYKNVLLDIESYETMLRESDHADAREFKQTVEEGKSKRVSNTSPYTVSFVRQVLACTKREFWLTWGDKTSLYTKFFVIISNALIFGSLFYGQTADTMGTFSRGGTLFFSILFLGWLQLSELMKAVGGRAVIARHNDYAFYRPSAVVIARVLQDLPQLLLYVIPFSLIMYFLTGLDLVVGKFWIYFLFIYTTTICITALYRMFAALSPTIDDAVRFSGTGLNLLIIYTGYVIAKPLLISKYIWFGWIYYINPVAYSFEAVLTNELSNKRLECSPAQIVPSGPTYNNPLYQGCATPGAQIGSLSVSGATYLQTALEYSRSNLWRNFGVVIAFTFLYILVTAAGSELFNFTKEGGGALEFIKSKTTKKQLKSDTPTSDAENADVEKGKIERTNTNVRPTKTLSRAQEEEILQNIESAGSVFTWENVSYTVPYMGGERQLLNKVCGYAKPGCLIALMGASGAGKTTLLNTLSQRQKTGVVTGDMLVDGRPLGLEFQRGTGFCEQMDLHDGTQTIEEALQFSAILRQERDIPRSEKLAYADKIIDLLELRGMKDVLVRSLGVEPRKRVTIGVELAAKPNLLLFLDEPTSGLDSQSADSIIRFLKKLTHAGQAIVCTIHQPSANLFQQFDMVLGLNPKGNTFYFGPIGDNGSDVIKYFADRGVQCPPQKNVAEFILETAAKGGKREDGRRLNWTDEWRNSENAKELMQEIQRIKAERGEVELNLNIQQHEFASTVLSQTTELTKRLFINYWRDPSYLYGKIFISVIIGIFNGFTFYSLGNTIADMQNRMFTSFLILLIPPTIVNGVVPKFYGNRALWEARELPSRIYGWFAFCSANVLAEIPIAIFGGTIYWVLWYWATGLPTDSSTSGYVFLMVVLFFLFQASWGQWICAFAPSFTVISNILPSFFVIFSLFNGVVRPYNAITPFWRYWMYWLNPSTYWIGGVLSATLPGTQIQCSPTEAAYFNPPPNQTCGTYARDFLTQVGQGYLINPEDTANCGYCQYRDGNEYMRTLNIEPSDKWRYFGIFLAFCFTNWMLVYFFIYTVRVRGWTFGIASLFGGVKMGFGWISGKAKMVKGGGKEEVKDV